MSEQNERWLWQVLIILMLLLFAVIATPTLAQAQESCLQCHEDESSNVKHSVHSFLSCTSCHTDIEDFPHSEGASLDKKESVVTCSSCHEGQITDSYAASFHSKAVQLDSQKSAACVDCHGAHEILGPDNPDSKVAKENIAETCAGCHGQASPGFSQGTEHFKLAAIGEGAPMFYTAKFFIWLTILTVTALVIHIELQLYQNLRTILWERKKGR